MKKKKKKHTYSLKVGDETLYKPLTAEHLGCLIIVLPIMIFIFFIAVMLILKKLNYIQF